MAFPIVENITTTHIGADLTSHTINIPTCAVGDLIVVFFTCDNASVLISIDETSSDDGWYKFTQLTSANNTSAIFLKAALTIDDLVLTLDSAQQSTAITYRISGYNNYLPAQSSQYSYGANINPPPIATSGTNDILFLVYGGTDGAIVASAAPINFTGLTTVTGSSDGSSSSSAYRYLTRLAGSANYDPGSFTSSAADWVSFTMCIYPDNSDVGFISNLGIVEP